MADRGAAPAAGDKFPIVFKKYAELLSQADPGPMPLAVKYAKSAYTIDPKFVSWVGFNLFRFPGSRWREPLSDCAEIRHRMIASETLEIGPAEKLFRFFKDFLRGVLMGRFPVQSLIYHMSGSSQEANPTTMLLIVLLHKQKVEKSVILHCSEFDRTRTRNYTKAKTLLKAYRELLGLPITSDEFAVDDSVR